MPRRKCLFVGGNLVFCKAIVKLHKNLLTSGLGESIEPVGNGNPKNTLFQAGDAESKLRDLKSQDALESPSSARASDEFDSSGDSGASNSLEPKDSFRRHDKYFGSSENISLKSTYEKPILTTRERLLAYDSPLRPELQEKINEIDRKMTIEFFQKLEDIAGVTQDVFLQAFSRLSDKELATPARATREMLFKNIDIPYAKKIQALMQYDKFLRKRHSNIQRLAQEDSKAQILQGGAQREISKDANDGVDAMTKHTVDVGLSILRAQS